ncbi:MAG: electron transfer flavoprotein subunit beta/FixA family protein [Dehalococcoidales bacterium]|nr:electron transfer flavoprotein subunit beta/FixA family protein [Dehalococcoidales bacterium]
MNIAVCVKPVPDVSIVFLDTQTGHINSDDLVYIVNPYDMVALEEAVRIKERDGTSRVTLISMAPPSSKRLLRQCLAMGADEIILLWDKSFEDSDSYATGVILAKYIGSGQYDLILCGQKAIDTEAGQVGSVIAERLNIPLVSRVVKIDVSQEDGKADVESKLEKGNRARIEVSLPVLFTVELDLNEPRYASLPSLMAGLRKDITECNREKLGLSYGEVGSEGARTRTTGLSNPKPRPKKIFTPDSRLSAEERLRLVISGGVTQKQSDVLEGDPGKIAKTVVQFLSEKQFLPTEHE